MIMGSRGDEGGCRRLGYGTVSMVAIFGLGVIIRIRISDNGLGFE